MEHPLRTAKKVKGSMLLSIALALSTGCHKEQAQVYNAANDQGQPQPTVAVTPTNSSSMDLPPGHPDISSAPMQAATTAPASHSAAPLLTWALPVGWTEVAPSEMRVASFSIVDANNKHADVSVIPLSGMGGGDLPNVNRWRGQVGLAKTTEDQLSAMAESVEAAGQPAQLYDITGKSPDNGQATRILVAIEHRGDTSWYFKMMGDADLVEQQKPTFITFLKSLSFTAEQTQGQLPPGQPAISDTGATSTASPARTPGEAILQVPPGWQAVDAGEFLVAKFSITNDSGAATVNVSSSKGDGGGLMPNVNRWRGQLGLPPQMMLLSTTFEVSGGEAQMVDMTGTDAQTGQSAEIVGAIVTQPGRTWFYKLMGDPKVVSAQKDTFTQFVQGVKY